MLSEKLPLQHSSPKDNILLMVSRPKDLLVIKGLNIFSMLNNKKRVFLILNFFLVLQLNIIEFNVNSHSCGTILEVVMLV